MPDAATLVAFVTTSVILAFIPGPDNLFVLTQSALRGWRVGVAVTLGLCTGLIVHTTAVALGISVLFQQSETAFTILKLAGAAYLLYLAYGALRAGPASAQAAEGQAQPYLRLYLRGIVMNVTNPKVAIFFLAFFPQFITADGGPVGAQVALLGLLFILSALSVFTGIALAAGFLSRRLLASDRAQRWLNRVAGLLFIALAAKLALAQR